MKTLYVFMIFLIFFNIFAFMFAWLNIFPTTIGLNEQFNISSDKTSAEQLFYNISGGFDINDMFAIFFFDINNISNVVVSGLVLTGAALVAWLTRSPSPFVVAFIGNIMFNMYQKSVAIFQQFPINNYLMLVGMFGMIMLFIVTVAETLTHGDV